MGNNVEINEENETRLDKARRRLVVVWTWVGSILLLAAALYVANLLSVAIGIIVWTIVFVFVLRGPVNFLERHGVNRMLGTVIAYVVFVALLAFIVFIMFSPTFGIDAQFEELMKGIPTYVEAFRTWATDFYEQHSDLLQNATVKNWVDSTTEALGQWLQGFASAGASGVVAVGTSLANIFVCIGFALVVAFWMLVELPNLGREANRVIGEKYRADAEMLHLTVTRVMGGYLRTTIIQCTIIGALCGVLFAILGVPSPAAFGVITGILNIIPIVGPWLGGALAFVASVVESPLTGIIALIGTIVIQQLIYTFLSPKLMGDSVDIHPALTFIALMAGSGIGTAMGGMVGALVGTLLSIPFVAMAKSVFVYYFEKRTGRRIVAEDGVFFKGATSTDDEVNPMADATAPGTMPTASSGNAGMVKGFTGKFAPVGSRSSESHDVGDWLAGKRGARDQDAEGQDARVRSAEGQDAEGRNAEGQADAANEAAARSDDGETTSGD